MAGELDMNSPTEVARSLRAFPNVTVVRVPFGPHALTSPASPMGDCVRGMLRTFLATKQVTDQKCTGETYRALGAFPQTVEDVPPYPTRGLSTTQRRVLAATFPTAADATARRNPDSTVYARVPNEPGLRGGQVTFGEDVLLHEVRFVRDLQVSGHIKLSADGHATAALHAKTGGRTHEVTLTWAAFSTHQSVSGTFDGIPFDSRPCRRQRDGRLHVRGANKAACPGCNPSRVMSDPQGKAAGPTRNSTSSRYGFCSSPPVVQMRRSEGVLGAALSSSPNERYPFPHATLRLAGHRLTSLSALRGQG
jgi:hypothetical protein